MSRRQKLLREIQEILQSPVTETERRRLQQMLTTLMSMESEIVDENSWTGQVDRQGGSFTAEEILNSKAWR